MIEYVSSSYIILYIYTTNIKYLYTPRTPKFVDVTTIHSNPFTSTNSILAFSTTIPPTKTQPYPPPHYS